MSLRDPSGTPFLFTGIKRTLRNVPQHARIFSGKSKKGWESLWKISRSRKGPLGLYDPQFEHDACGIGAVVDIKGRKSHQTVDDALSIVERLEHRAGKDAEGKTGDGVGIMLQISHKFFSKVAEELNIRLGNEREYGVGMFFFPQNEHLRAQAMKLFEVVTRKEGLEFLAWRAVP